VQVVIAEDEVLLREGLLLVLGAAGIEVAGVAADAGELVRLARETSPDLIIADIRMPPGYADDGLRAAMEIRARLPKTAILVLSQHVNRQYARELTQEGTSGVGYLLKERVADVTGFIRDLERVAAGGTALDPEVVSMMVARARRDDSAVDQLTPRQSEVLSLVAEGRSNAAIARQLVISEKAVVQHVSRIYEQLGLGNSNEDHRRVLAVIQYLSR
jgi:DNA-binding NarL/FixJ family response regulator